MTTPKGTGLPQHSFFHTPGPLSPLAAMVTTGAQLAPKTVYIPQRKLDVATEDSWNLSRKPSDSCVHNVIVCVCMGVVAVFLFSVWWAFYIINSEQFTAASLPSFLSQPALKLAARQASAVAQWTDFKFTRYSWTLLSGSLWCWVSQDSICII